MKDNLRFSQDTRKKDIQENPVWKKYHTLHDNIIEDKLSAKEAINEYMKLAHAMLQSTQERDKLQHIVGGLEHMADDILLIYPTVEETYQDTEEEKIISQINTLLFTVDEEQQYLNELKKQLQLYVQTTTD